MDLQSTSDKFKQFESDSNTIMNENLKGQQTIKDSKNKEADKRNDDRNQVKSTRNDVNNNSKDKNTKRDDYLIWEDYFMSIALLSAKRSKDPSTQVGACIVNNDNKIVSIGYNGMPTSCNDDLLPWGKHSDNELENKYL
jgi:hypothetical protein